MIALIFIIVISLTIFIIDRKIKAYNLELKKSIIKAKKTNKECNATIAKNKIETEIFLKNLREWNKELSRTMEGGD